MLWFFGREGFGGVGAPTAMDGGLRRGGRRLPSSSSSSISRDGGRGWGVAEGGQLLAEERGQPMRADGRPRRGARVGGG